MDSFFEFLVKNLPRRFIDELFIIAKNIPRNTAAKVAQCPHLLSLCYLLKRMKLVQNFLITLLYSSSAFCKVRLFK